MLTKDKVAITHYLEFGLVEFLSKYEEHIDEDMVGVFYADAFGLLSDLDDTMQLAVDCTPKQGDKQHR